MRRSMHRLCVDMIVVKDLSANIPTAESLELTSRAFSTISDPPLPSSTITETKPKRDDWMLDPTVTTVISDTNSSIPLGITEDVSMEDTSGRAAPAPTDFFSSLGTELRPKPPPKNPDQDKVSHIPYRLCIIEI